MRLGNKKVRWCRVQLWEQNEAAVCMVKRNGPWMCSLGKKQVVQACAEGRCSTLQVLLNCLGGFPSVPALTSSQFHSISIFGTEHFYKQLPRWCKCEAMLKTRQWLSTGKTSGIEIKNQKGNRNVEIYHIPHILDLHITEDRFYKCLGIPQICRKLRLICKMS